MTDPLASLGAWLLGLLDKLNLSPEFSRVILNITGVAVIATVILVIFILQTWIERKISARVQDRIGPNRVGPWGILQPLADTVKMITKEDTTPDGADRFAYNLAPLLSVVSVLLIWAVVPFTESWFGTSLNVGVLYIAAVGSFGIVAVLMAGWSSNNKYALLGAFRAVAQLISYEVPLFLTLIVPVLLARSMNLNEIVLAQGSFAEWFIWSAPLAWLIFFISSMAEAGRTPFDLLEAESEIVAGYHIEYSGMKFGMFQAGEFMHAFTIGALTAILFFGGWQGPGVELFPWLGVVYLFVKAFLFYSVTMWVRFSIPRIRIDHLQALNWKFLVPVALVLLMVTPLVDYFTKGLDLVLRTGAFLVANLLVTLLAVEMIRRAGKHQQANRVTFPTRKEARPPAEEAAA